MKTPFMQLVDGYIGRPLCRVRSLLFRRQRPFPDKVDKILITKMFGLGSMVLMTPMVNSIRNGFPKAKIYFMTFKNNADLCGYYNLCDEVIPVRRDNFFNFIKDTFNIAKRVKKENINIVIDAEFFSRYTALFTSLCPSAFLIGFFNRNMYRGRFLDRRCYFNQYYHMKKNFMELANTFCAPAKDLKVNYPVISQQAREKVKKILAESGLPQGPVIIFNPQTSDITPSIDRSWPLENFAQFGKYLINKGYNIAVIGETKQAKRAEELARMCGNKAVSLAAKTSIEELIALFERAFCVVTNDSAPLHIAASLNVATISFFGTDTPSLYGYTQAIHTTFFKNLPCSPCLSIFNYKKGECEFDSRCVRSIVSGEVIEEFEKQENLLKREYEKRKAKRDS